VPRSTDSLSGNLCRCTGYKPIIDAAHKASAAGAVALKIDDSRDLPLLREIRRPRTPTYNLDGDIVVQPVVRTRKGNEFVSPSTLAEVADYLLKHPETTLLAGSTEIGLQVNKQFARPTTFAYLGNVAELRKVEDKEHAWRIGAQVSLTEVEELVTDAYPDFRRGAAPLRVAADPFHRDAGRQHCQRITHRRFDALPAGIGRHAAPAPGRNDAVMWRWTRSTRARNRTCSGRANSSNRSNCPSPCGARCFHAHKISKRFEQDISATCCALHYRVVKGVHVQGCAPGLQRTDALALLARQRLKRCSKAARRRGDAAGAGRRDCRQLHAARRPSCHLDLSRS
jgi:xanthine dehydrogenase small subunit